MRYTYGGLRQRIWGVKNMCDRLACALFTYRKSDNLPISSFSSCSNIQLIQHLLIS
ncbi:MAG: hypothetical protein WBV73_31790 [Phormidium sp.]